MTRNITRKYYKKSISKKRRSYKKKGRYTKKKHIIRGGEKGTSKQINDFRIMFINAFNKLQNAINTGKIENIDDAISKFKNGLNGNKNEINTLIPINAEGLPVDKYQENSGLTSLVPPLVVIFRNIPDEYIRKRLFNTFSSIRGFNINLTNYVRDSNVLLEAIKLNDKILVEFLLRKGASPEMLTEEQKNMMDELLREPVLNSTLNSVLEQSEVVAESKSDYLSVKDMPFKPSKLNIGMKLPDDSGYDLNVEPEFWKSIFAENEMYSIKKQINDIMNIDETIPINNGELSQLWSICEIVKSIIPTFYIPTKNKPYFLFDTFTHDSDIDFSKFNIILCATLIIVGIISYKMIGQDYKILFKGGKAIQLVLTGIPNISEYISEDIDILVMPNNILYDEASIKNLAGHLAYLIRWFLNVPQTNYNISVQPPNPEKLKANPHIFKLSYIKFYKKYDSRKQIKIDEYKQFSDIDFKEVPTDIKPFFESEQREFNFDISLSGDTRQHLLFVSPNLGALLNEKIYYYTKYFKYKQLLESKKQITDPGYETLTIDDCNRFLEKFKRAIVIMNNGLQIQRQTHKQKDVDKDTIDKMEKESIIKRVGHIGFTNEKFQKKIYDSLYNLTASASSMTTVPAYTNNSIQAKVSVFKPKATAAEWKPSASAAEWKPKSTASKL
jgi:hypothetical protein